MGNDESTQRARALFEAGDFTGARESALSALGSAKDDVELLRIAGRAGVELESDDAVEQLQRVVELEPRDPDCWNYLGDALAAEGRTEEALGAFRKTLELRPDDPIALAHLGHGAAELGQEDEAISFLSRAAENEPAWGSSSAVISLVEIYRSVGQLDLALETARKILAVAPNDLRAAVDVAELSLTVGKLDEAMSAWERVHQLDDVPGHDVYALHGMVQVAIKQSDWNRALELAREASAADQHEATSELIAFLQAQLGQDSEGTTPTLEQIETAFAAEQDTHRRAHAEDLRFEDADLGR